VGVGDHRTRHGQPGVDVKVAGLAIEALFGHSKKHTVNL